MSIQIASTVGPPDLTPSFRPPLGTGSRLLSAVAPMFAGNGKPAPFVTEASVVIRAPATHIWPHVLHPMAWKKDPILLPMPPVDERTRFKATRPEAPDTLLFYVDVVEALEGRRKTVRISAPDESLLAYESWQLDPRDDTTLLDYHVCGYPPIADDRTTRRIVHELETLKGIVEGTLAPRP